MTKSLLVLIESSVLARASTSLAIFILGLQTSMSGISVTEDAVNLYYYLKAKSVVRLIQVTAILVPRKTANGFSNTWVLA